MTHPPQDPQYPGGPYGQNPPTGDAPNPGQYPQGGQAPNGAYQQPQYPSNQQWGPDQQGQFGPGGGNFPPQQFAGQPDHGNGSVPAAPEKKKSWVSRHKILTGLLALLALGALSQCGGGGDTTTTPPAASQEATTAAPKASEAAAPKSAEAAPALPGLNEVVHYNTFDFTVTSVKCGVPSVGSEYVKEKAQGEFCLVGLTVKNTGSKAQTFMADNQKLLDDKGTEYSYSSEATVAQLSTNDNSDVWFKEINPGNSVKGVLIYDVPQGTKPSKLHVSDGGFTDQGTDIALK